MVLIEFEVQFIPTLRCSLEPGNGVRDFDGIPSEIVRVASEN